MLPAVTGALLCLFACLCICIPPKHSRRLWSSGRGAMPSIPLQVPLAAAFGLGALALPWLDFEARVLLFAIASFGISKLCLEDLRAARVSRNSGASPPSSTALSRDKGDTERPAKVPNDLRSHGRRDALTPSLGEPTP